ncbi:CAP superfamily protein [Forsythia ovata]|uniref:CAP superfamily protein n=1 Tax=Forsythia ovata TaxID=205694 RepID=A0ABD1SPQ6_9LAMI
MRIEQTSPCLLPLPMQMETLQMFREQGIRDRVHQWYHENGYASRSALRLAPLVWDARLSSYAEWYANLRRWDCALEHSNGPYGENIFWGSGNGWMPANAAMAWVSERRWYNYWSNSCAHGKECGHYTQIVWRDTRKIGCARVICNGGKGVFMICNYDPPGNYIGEKPY